MRNIESKIKIFEQHLKNKSAVKQSKDISIKKSNKIFELKKIFESNIQNDLKTDRERKDKLILLDEELDLKAPVEEEKSNHSPEIGNAFTKNFQKLLNKANKINFKLNINSPILMNNIGLNNIENCKTGKENRISKKMKQLIQKFDKKINNEHQIHKNNFVNKNIEMIQINKLTENIQSNNTKEDLNRNEPVGFNAFIGINSLINKDNNNINKDNYNININNINLKDPLVNNVKVSIQEIKNENINESKKIKNFENYKNIIDLESQEELTTMKNDITEIEKDFLYLSSYKAASTISLLKQLNITNIMNCSGQYCENVGGNSFEYSTFYLKDNVQENIECILFDCIEIFEKLKNENKKILVHCFQGISRSVSIIIAYLMYKNNWDYEQAFNFIQNKRSIANPNIGFYLQLKSFNKKIKENIDRLEIYAICSFQIEQPEYLVSKEVFNDIDEMIKLKYNNININNNNNINCNDNINYDNNIGNNNNKNDSKSFINNFINNTTLSGKDMVRNKEENKEEEIDKEMKIIELSDKGLYLFVTKEHCFLLKGDNVPEENINKYIEAGKEQLRKLKKFENLGGNEDTITNVKVISLDEKNEQFDELLNLHNIKVKFVTKSKLDKYYISLSKVNKEERKIKENEDQIKNKKGFYLYPNKEYDKILNIEDLESKDYLIACVEENNLRRLFIWKGPECEENVDNINEYKNYVKNNFFNLPVDYEKEEVPYEESEEFMNLL